MNVKNKILKIRRPGRSATFAVVAVSFISCMTALTKGIDSGLFVHTLVHIVSMYAIYLLVCMVIDTYRDYVQLRVKIKILGHGDLLDDDDP